jgi:hypothetical protein
MSYPSLLYGVKSFYLEHLKYNNQKLDENFVDVMIDGRPPGVAPEIFVAIHQGTVKGTNYEILDAIYSVQVTITFRVAKWPHDRFGVLAVLDKELGLGQFLHKVVEITHMNYDILRRANEYLVAPNKQPWIEPLRMNTISAPKLVDGSWFHAREGNEEAVIQTIVFGDARRVQFGEFQPITENVPLLPDFLQDR